MEAEAAAEAFLNAGVDMAVRSIANEGAFYPFGMRMDADDKLTMAAAKIPDDEIPTQEQVLALLWGGLASDAKEGAQAVGVFTDVGLSEGALEGFSEAIELAFEHASGFCEAFLVPYRNADEGFEIGPLLSVERDAKAFV